jgi:hypothetical protein
LELPKIVLSPLLILALISRAQILQRKLQMTTTHKNLAQLAVFVSCVEAKRFFQHLALYLVRRSQAQRPRSDSRQLILFPAARVAARLCDFRFLEP